MKLLISLIITTISLISCNAVDSLTKFTMEYNETVVIPSSSGINLPINIFTPDVETNSETTFEVNNTRKDLIEQIKLTELSLEITSPQNADFSFLESASIFISADGLEETEIAWIDKVPEASKITLNMTNADLQEFIKKDNFALKLHTVTDEFITSDQHIEIFSKFFVDAKILGQ